MPRPITCPECGQPDLVEKASTIYMRGVAEKWKGRVASQTPASQASTAFFAEMEPAELQKLSRRLAPPSTGKQAPTRPIHPNLAVLAFSLVSPIFLYGIYTSQPGALIPILALLAGFYATYFWKRRSILARFEAQLLKQEKARNRVNMALERWMETYYCAREDVVFLLEDAPASQAPGKTAPADQLAGLLFSE